MKSFSTPRKGRSIEESDRSWPLTSVFFYIHMRLYQVQSFNINLFWKLISKRSKIVIPPTREANNETRESMLIPKQASESPYLTKLSWFTTLHSFKLFVLKNKNKDITLEKNGSSGENCFPTAIWDWIGSSWIRQKKDSYHPFTRCSRLSNAAYC